jgi:hypothetical protein
MPKSNQRGYIFCCKRFPACKRFYSIAEFSGGDAFDTTEYGAFVVLDDGHGRELEEERK